MTTTTKERPILFSGPMVRAIIGGRKTQTRRPIKSVKGFGAVTEFKKSSTPGYDFTFRCRRRLWQDLRKADLINLSPFGPPGTLLWLQETWCPQIVNGLAHHLFKASWPQVDKHGIATPAPTFRWRPSIHMPRWASRIILRNKRTWVERVQDISEEDARAEGVTPTIPIYGDCGGFKHEGGRDAFWRLWDSTYPNSWDANEWVWACEFERVQ